MKRSRIGAMVLLCMIPACDVSDEGVKSAPVLDSGTGGGAGADAGTAGVGGGTGGAYDGGAEADAPDKYATLEAEFEQLRQLNKIVGMAAAVIEDGEITWMKGFGKRKSGVGAPAVQTSTLFLNGTLGIMLPAVLTLQLADEGKLGLDDTVVTHIPELSLDWDPEGWLAQMKVRHLLSWSSGLHTHLEGAPAGTSDDSGLLQWATSSEFTTKEYLEYPPGTTTGGMLTQVKLYALVAEKASGTPVRTAITSKVLEPLGMTRTKYGSKAVAGDEDIAYSYPAAVTDADPAQANVFLPMTSIADVATFMRFMLNGNPAILSDAQRTAAFSKQGTGYLGRCNSGYGVATGDAYCDPSGNISIGHPVAYEGTALNAYSTFVFFVPDLKFGFALMTNTSVGWWFPDFIASALKVIGIQSFQPEVSPPDTANYAKLAGSYPAHSPTGEPSFTVTLSGDTLKLSSTDYSCDLKPANSAFGFKCETAPPDSKSSDVNFILNQNNEVEYINAFYSINARAEPDGG